MSKRTNIEIAKGLAGTLLTQLGMSPKPNAQKKDGDEDLLPAAPTAAPTANTSKGKSGRNKGQGRRNFRAPGAVGRHHFAVKGRRDAGLVLSQDIETTDREHKELGNDNQQAPLRSIWDPTTTLRDSAWCPN